MDGSALSGRMVTVAINQHVVSMELMRSANMAQFAAASWLRGELSAVIRLHNQALIQ